MTLQPQTDYPSYITGDDMLVGLLILAVVIAGLAVAWGTLKGASSVAGAVLRAQGAPDHKPFRWLVVGHWAVWLAALVAALIGVSVAPLHTIAVCAIVAVFLLYRRLGRKQA